MWPVPPILPTWEWHHQNPNVDTWLTWLKACFQLWEQINPETSPCHISWSWPCPIACADYSAMPIGNLAGFHHIVDARNTNMHAQHSREQASTIVQLVTQVFLPHSCFHYITWLPSPIYIAFSTTCLQWHWYQMEDADNQSSTAARLSRHCHHAQDYRQRIWSIRKATKHSLRCEYGILSIKREWSFHRVPLQVYWSFSTCKITQPYLQPLLFRVLFFLQCHHSLLEDESQIRRD